MMVRLLGTTTGWESGSVDELAGASHTDTATVAVVTATPTPASGTYCLKCASTAASGNTGSWRSFSLGGTQTDIWLRFRLYTSHAGEATLSRLARFVDTAGTVIAYLSVDPSTGTLKAYRAGNTATGTLGSTTAHTGATLLGTASANLAAGWNLVEVHFIPTTGATGTFEVWLNGSQVINATGVQTSAGLANVVGFTLGWERNTVVGGVSGNYTAYDDTAVNDTTGATNTGRPGDYLVTWLVPSGAGASTNWTPSAGSNYQCLDEIPPSAADYVSTTAAATIDDYAITNLPALALTVTYLESVAFGKNPDGGAGQLKVGLISGGTTSSGTTHPLSATDRYVRTGYEVNPDGPAAWTKTSVDAAKLRIESV